MEAVLRTVRSFTASLTSAHYMLTLVMTIQDVSRHRQMPLQEQSPLRRSPALDSKILDSKILGKALIILSIKPMMWKCKCSVHVY